MHINKSIVSTNSMLSDPTVSVMTCEDNEYKEYNPHVDGDIDALKIGQFKSYKARHYSLFDDEVKQQPFDIVNMRESSLSVGMRQKLKKRRKRSHSESDLSR